MYFTLTKKPAPSQDSPPRTGCLRGCCEQASPGQAFVQVLQVLEPGENREEINSSCTFPIQRWDEHGESNLGSLRAISLHNTRIPWWEACSREEDQNPDCHRLPASTKQDSLRSIYIAHRLQRCPLSSQALPTTCQTHLDQLSVTQHLMVWVPHIEATRFASSLGHQWCKHSRGHLPREINEKNGPWKD